MRFALLSDIHGHLQALEAALTDVASQGGVDGYWLLGDFAAMGPDPLGVLRRVTELPNTRFVRGNTDRYIVTGERPALAPEATADQVRGALEVFSSFTWTQGVIEFSGLRDWLAGLPLDFRETLPDGTRVLAVHASPGTDDGLGLRPGLSDDEALALFAGADADLVLVGHTHWPADRRLPGGPRVVNVGSIGLPFTPDSQSCYALLDVDDDGVRITHCRLPLDTAQVADSLAAVHHPSADLINGLLDGRRRPAWAK
jgi:predicted phosphodiesterase